MAFLALLFLSLCGVFTQTYAANYRVTVDTGNVDSAGTDAKVSLTIIGNRGRTEQLELPEDAQKSKFERGNTNDFDVSSSANVGTITNIIIGHDNSGVRPGWFLNTVRVRKVFTTAEAAEILEFVKARGGSHKSGTCYRRGDEVYGVVYNDLFNGKGLAKTPAYVEYEFNWKNWIAADELDRTLEKTLDVSKKTVGFSSA
ncbi:lipoxygenase homology domain-containing protein 1-like [Physella acuta]|uniref:lipoxygenase homology domain-containing protein 1-like n=1 Tax=Physella acuta TaxID=109671 RepID=UPI0027DCC25D|nr:lipoxygenase homology domain-containing protein 1-like [Physella acuta]